MSAAPENGGARGRNTARFVLFKQGVITAHESHFAGGKHAFLSMATTLAAKGFDVALVSIASRAKVLVHAGMTGLLPQLSFAQHGVVTWREQGVHHHVILSDEPPPGSGTASSSSSVSVTAAFAAAVASYVGRLAHDIPRTTVQTAGQRAQADEGIAGDIAAGAPGGDGGGDGSDVPGQRASCNRTSSTDDGDDGLGGSTPSGTWVIIDADESQKLLPPPPSPSPPPASDFANAIASNASSASSDTDMSLLPVGGVRGGRLAEEVGAGTAAAAGTTLFELIVAAAPPRRCLSYVQNVHFLPMGPSGTGSRRRELHAAWSRLGAVLGVSEFVAGYVQQHWPPGDGAAAAAPPPPPVRVVPLAAWGVYGRPPFPDLAAVARPRLQIWRAAVQRRPPSPPVAGQGTAVAAVAAAAAPVVDVAVLKLTPEKGTSIVVELARRLAGRVRFRAVSGDPTAATVLAPLLSLSSCPATGSESGFVAGSGSASSSEFRHNGAGFSSSSSLMTQGASGVAAAAAPLELWEPQPDVGRVLSGCVAVLAPSLWLEAWGMVVTEALLRGLPVLISDLGGLPEAGMRLCPAVPVAPIRIPTDAQGVPDWSARAYPKQDIDAWEAALLRLLLSNEHIRTDGGDATPSRSGKAAVAVAATAAVAWSSAAADIAGNCHGLVVGVDGNDASQPYPLAVAEGGEVRGVRDGGGGDDGAAGDGDGRGGRGDECLWEQLSRAGREAAMAHVIRGSVFLAEWLQWLAGL